MKTFIESVLCVLLAGISAASLRAAQTYTMVDTGQTKCYDNRNEIAPPKPGQPFYGQDAQFHNHPASYILSADGLTVHDNNTGLTWQRSPDTDGDGLLTRRDKLTLAQAQALPAKLNAAKFGGFDDWRLPTIKELYSLFAPAAPIPAAPAAMDTSRLTPFIDTKYFKFAYGDTSAGERVIDSQYAPAPSMSANPRAGSASCSASTLPMAGSKATTCSCRAAAWKRPFSCCASAAIRATAKTTSTTTATAPSPTARRA